MKKVFMLIAFMLSIGLMVAGAQAATSSLPQLPGGAGIGYFTCGNNEVTLVNIQNIPISGSSSTPHTVGSWYGAGDRSLVVHIVLYDTTSNEIINFNVPLSEKDNWGAAITCDGSRLTVTPQTPVYFTGGPYTGAEVRTAPTTARAGYLTAAITAIAAVNVNADPRLTANLANTDVYLPDALIMRFAYLNQSAGTAFAMNGQMLQGFANIATLNIPGDLWDSVADIQRTTGVYSGTTTSFVGTDDLNGIRIDSWELFITDNLDSTTPRLVCDANTNTFYKALGSSNDIYWARYNVTPGLSTTNLVTVMPANNGPGNVLPTGHNSRTMGLIIYNDNEDAISDTETVVEAASTSVGNVINTNGTSGEIRITVTSPMFGFSVTTVNANAVDTYPIIPEKVNLYHTNISGTQRTGVSEVLRLASE